MSTGRVLLTFVGLFTAISPYIADFNETHVYNTSWTPHAKFHNGQTMSMGVYLGAMTIYFALRKSRDPVDSLNNAVISALAYWVTQFSGLFYPGSLPADPPQDPHYFIQKYPIGLVVVLTAWGYYVERKRLSSVKLD